MLCACSKAVKRDDALTILLESQLIRVVILGAGQLALFCSE